MISRDAIRNIARRYRASEYPNIIREYFQHLFLSELYKLEAADKLLFKGGTALRIVYQSPRFSEDLDFTLSGVAAHRRKEFVENLFAAVLANIERMGATVALGEKPGPTSGGYYGRAEFRAYDYHPAIVAINISSRRGMSGRGEIDTIANDFIPPYTLCHLSEDELVSEKIFGALLARGKARDFYDLYFIMRHGMLVSAQKKRLVPVRERIIAMANEIDFQSELSMFLPLDQQDIVKRFPQTLANEMRRQLAE